MFSSLKMHSSLHARKRRSSVGAYLWIWDILYYYNCWVLGILYSRYKKGLTKVMQGVKELMFIEINQASFNPYKP